MAQQEPDSRRATYRVRLSPVVLTTFIIGLLTEGAVGGFAIVQLFSGNSSLNWLLLTVFVIVTTLLLFATSIVSVSRDLAAQAGLGSDDRPDIP